MRYSVLGKTGLKVSALSYGASSLGGAFGPVSEEGAKRVVRTALDLGVNLLDVSPFYGQTQAETILGKALGGVPRERYLLSTKVGRYGQDEFDFSADRVTRSVEESLSRLNTDHVDLIVCHDVEFVSLSQIVNETLPALRKIREQGKVRYIGISGLPLKIFPTVLKQAELDFVLSYCHYTLYDTSLDDLLPYLTEKQVGVISAAPLGMGLLSGRPLPPWHPAPQELQDACARAAEFCKENSIPLAQLAMEFALSNPDIHSTMVGTSSDTELLRNIAWMQSPIEAELWYAVLDIFKPVQNKTWLSGLPENNGAYTL